MWNVRVAVVGGLVAGLMCAAGATAWAETFTPSIEEPVIGLGLLRGTPLGGVVPDGGSASAERGRAQSHSTSQSYSTSRSTSGRDYRHGSADDLLAETPAEKYGYWRTGSGADDQDDN